MGMQKFKGLTTSVQIYQLESGLSVTAIKLSRSYAPRLVRGVQKYRFVAGFLDSADKPRNVGNWNNSLNLMAVVLCCYTRRYERMFGIKAEL